MKKPSIPAIQTDKGGVLGPIKEILESITGQRGGKIAQLSGDVPLEGAIAKINEILTLLQDTAAGKIGESVSVATLETTTLTTDELTAGNFVGMIAFFGAASSIHGWLKTDGATYNTADYPALAAFLGEAGATFAVPDIRGEFLRVLDDGREVDPGRLIGSYQVDELKSHIHANGFSAMGQTAGGAGYWGGAAATDTAATGGTETRPRNVAYPAYIKT